MNFGSHEQWFRATAALAVVGGVLMGGGALLHLDTVRRFGTLLLYPLLALSALAIVVGIPLGLWVRRTEGRKR
jgi:hypothetical protein